MATTTLRPTATRIIDAAVGAHAMNQAEPFSTRVVADTGPTSSNGGQR